jgi:hypothetical protein
MDNREAAIVAKVTELAERYKIQPFQFRASLIQPPPQPPKTPYRGHDSYVASPWNTEPDIDPELYDEQGRPHRATPTRQDPPYLLLSNLSERLPQPQINRFLNAIGVYRRPEQNDYILQGSHSEILQKLCDALDVAPQSRSKGKAEPSRR